MASSLPTVSASATRTLKISSSTNCHYHHSKLSFRISSKVKPKLSFSTKGSKINWNHSCVTRAQLNEVSVDGSSNASPSPIKKSEEPESELSPQVAASEAEISEFMTQVASLVKLVDSRDIVELQLKQCDCELIIRKKEALPQPPAPAVMTHSSSSAAMPVQLPPAQASAPPASAAPGLSTAPAPTAPPAAKSAKSLLPPLKCPMAGTFYRSRAPGEPPFVKVGDKVNKGQVVCIIEAMKLMNEIEADQSGTIVEILAEDCKPVSVDTPLFVIEP